MSNQRKKKLGKSNIAVEIDGPMKDTVIAIELIKKLLKINKIKLDLSIAYDFEYEDLGMYLPNDGDQSFRIFVNPFNCKYVEDVETNKTDEIFARGYTSDLTLFGVTIHEFCHLLQYQVYPDIVLEYAKDFPIDRFYLNDYANNDLLDELAEIMTLYITNPFLLKMISEPHYKFCKKFFKSPVSCTDSQCQYIYKKFPIRVKEHMKSYWKIGLDIEHDCFVRL